MPQRTNHVQVHQSIADLVGRPQAHGLVAAYFDPDRGFAGAMFDGLEPNGLLADNPADRFTVDDIAATSLLDVRFGPTAVRALLGSQDIAMALKAVPECLPLWKADEPELQVASRLWFLVRDIGGVGRTRASKLLARKRPQLLPIVDSVIAEALQLHFDTWGPLGQALKIGASWAPRVVPHDRPAGDRLAALLTCLRRRSRQHRWPFRFGAVDDRQYSPLPGHRMPA
jgi:hypothetical protein